MLTIIGISNAKQIFFMICQPLLPFKYVLCRICCGSQSICSFFKKLCRSFTALSRMVYFAVSLFRITQLPLSDKPCPCIFLLSLYLFLASGGFISRYFRALCGVCDRLFKLLPDILRFFFGLIP